MRVPPPTPPEGLDPKKQPPPNLLEVVDDFKNNLTIAETSLKKRIGLLQNRAVIVAAEIAELRSKDIDFSKSDVDRKKSIKIYNNDAFAVDFSRAGTAEKETLKIVELLGLPQKVDDIDDLEKLHLYIKEIEKFIKNGDNKISELNRRYNTLFYDAAEKTKPGQASLSPQVKEAMLTESRILEDQVIPVLIDLTSRFKGLLDELQDFDAFIRVYKSRIEMDAIKAAQGPLEVALINITVIMNLLKEPIQQSEKDSALDFSDTFGVFSTGILRVLMEQRKAQAPRLKAEKGLALILSNLSKALPGLSQAQAKSNEEEGLFEKALRSISNHTEIKGALDGLREEQKVPLPNFELDRISELLSAEVSAAREKVLAVLDANKREELQGEVDFFTQQMERQGAEFREAEARLKDEISEFGKTLDSERAANALYVNDLRRELGEISVVNRTLGSERASNGLKVAGLERQLDELTTELALKSERIGALEDLISIPISTGPSDPFEVIAEETLKGGAEAGRIARDTDPSMPAVLPAEPDVAEPAAEDPAEPAVVADIFGRPPYDLSQLPDSGDFPEPPKYAFGRVVGFIKERLWDPIPGNPKIEGSTPTIWNLWRNPRRK